jgi:hypothetical protein
MRRGVLGALLLGLLAATALSAQEPSSRAVLGAPCAVDPVCSGAEPSQSSEAQSSPSEQAAQAEPAPWQPVWGLSGLRVIAAGPKIAPNGQEFHPSFSIDLDFNLWLWRRRGLYLFGECRFWGERPEYGVTNARDGGLGFSKREFDLLGGAAWNYAGSWEARAYGYSLNNLNRGVDLVLPSGHNDGSVLENRYYLSPEYARLGTAGFDVARATFVSVGWLPTKELVGNNGKLFKPGLMLRAYLTQDLWNWPVYAFGDATFLTDRSLDARLLLFDVGLAGRPFRCWRQWEFRLGVENTADFQVGNVLNLWYVSLRYIF